MNKKRLLLLSLVAIGSVSACGGKVKVAIDDKPFNAEPARVVPQLQGDAAAGDSEIVVPNVEKEEPTEEAAAYSNKLLLNHKVAALFVGEQFELKGLPQALSAGDNLAFKSNDETIATVDENGMITGVAKGQTTIEVSDKDHPEVKTSVPTYVHEVLKTRQITSTVNKFKDINEDNLLEIVDHELYQKRKYKMVNGEPVLQLAAIWDQNLVCSYPEAYFRIYETDGDIITENGNMTFKDYEWVFNTNPYYDMYTYHQVGDVKTYYPVSMVAYMDEGKARYVPMFEILDNLFTNGRAVFTNTFSNAKLEGFLEYATQNYSNVAKNNFGTTADKTLLFDCTVTYSSTTADIDDEQRYGIPYGTPTPATYNLRFHVQDNQVMGYTNHGVQTYTIGEDEYMEVYDIDHYYERITDENRASFIYIPDKTQYTLVDYLFAI